MAETPPGIDNLKLWMKLNDNLATSAVINEVGDNGVLLDDGSNEVNTSYAHIRFIRQWVGSKLCIAGYFADRRGLNARFAN